MKNILLGLLFFSVSICVAQNGKEPYLIVGTYTSGKSDGIYVYKFNMENGDSKLIGSSKTSNPSYLAVSPDKKFVYCVNEDIPGMVTAFSFEKSSGKLISLNQQFSHGKHPCYITVDKSGKWVIAGNYSSGTLTIYQVNKDGSLGNATDSVQHEGSSVNTDRQGSPHVHSTVLSKSNKTLYVADLGMDKVMIYKFDNKKGKLTAAANPFVMTEAGSGPRHLDIHPNGKYAYLVEELTGNVSVYQVDKKENLILIQDISGLPRDFNGEVGSADIHVSPDGKFVYCSNRGGSNSLGIFRVNQSTGELAWVGYQSTLGKTPRNFNFDPSGNFLLAANQNSDEIVIFKRDKETGLLTDTGKRISVSKPVCIKWITTE